MYFSENSEVFCCLWVPISVTKHNFAKFYLKILAHKIALKTNENAQKSAELEHPKLQIKIWKIIFCDTFTLRQKTYYAIYPEKYFVNDDASYSQASYPYTVRWKGSDVSLQVKYALES